MKEPKILGWGRSVLYLLISVFMVLIGSFFYIPFEYIVASFACFIFFLWIINSDSGLKIIFVNSFFSNLGKISYSFYLIHLPIIVFLSEAVSTETLLSDAITKLLFLIVVFVVIFLFSKLLFETVEQYGILLGRRIIIDFNKLLDN